MKVTLFVLTLNEIQGMKEIMPRVKREWVDQIIVADGGSTDGTVEYANKLGYTTFVQKKKGIRQAYFEGFPKITGDAVITFSPDGNSLPEAIPAVVARLKEGYDMVIASRYLDHATSDDDDIVTRFGNWLFTSTINVLFGGAYTDALVIFRGYKKSLFYELELDKDEAYCTEKLFLTQIGVEPLLSIRSAKKGKRVTELPFDEPVRIGGKRKLQIVRWGGAYYLQFLREALTWGGSTRLKEMFEALLKVRRAVGSVNGAWRL